MEVTNAADWTARNKSKLAKHSLTSLAWNIFFCAVFYTQGGWGTRGCTTLLPVKLSGQLRTSQTAPVKSSCAKNVLSSLPLYSSRQERLASRAFWANRCCQVSGILWTDAVKTFFKPKGFQKNGQLCASTTSAAQLHKEINSRPDIPPKCEAALQAVT